MASDEELAHLQARIDADPRVQAIINDPKLDPRGKMMRLAALQKELLQSPHFFIDTDGTVRPDDGVDWQKWMIPAVGLGTLGAGAAGAFGPGVSSALGGGQGVANAVPAVSGNLAPTLPATPGAVSAGATTAGAGGAGSALSRVPWGEVARTAIPIGGALVASQVGQPDQGNGGMAELPPELRELMNLQMQRIRQSQPNYELMLNMARGMTPQWARDMPSPPGGRQAGPR